jgi:hypothetical protein
MLGNQTGFISREGKSIGFYFPDEGLYLITLKKQGSELNGIPCFNIVDWLGMA